MPTCPSCGMESRGSGRFCAECGTALDATSAETRTRAAGAARHPTSSHSSADDARFLPGDRVAGRYRIVGLLGRGGMGEVYRADDLKLGQPVALKFLPEALEGDESRLARFLNEVRVALRITHPNVCRVYDIGEVDGQHFISMEYVDGEDLASLLRRIGRLPQDRGTAIARQICAGLAAAHEQGILHRDLKPANIMIDGRGRARITDFGLANLASEIDASEVRAGTLAYMAPEQLAGQQVTERSDVYSLGLVLYEIFAGKPAFDATSAAEIARQRRSTAPSSMTTIVPGLDPAIEAVVLRALDADPERRPASALALAAALPGGDPLAAALAAGETPSPEMVAGAATRGGLRMPVAVACLAVALAGLVGITLRAPVDQILPRTDWVLTPTELSVRALDVVRELGGPERPEVVRDGLMVDRAYLDWLEDRDDSAAALAELDTPRSKAIRYWLRASPTRLEPASVHAFAVTAGDPLHDPPGGLAVVLAPDGRLTYARFRRDRVGGEGGPADARLFELAGLDMARFEPTEPVEPPEAPGDALAAWRGVPDGDDTEAVVQIGRLAGNVTYFAVVWPWQRAGDDEDESGGGGNWVSALIGLIVAGVLITGIVLARQNLLAGRGDRRGALRLVLFIVVTILVSWLFLDVRLRDLDVGYLFREMIFGRVLGHALLHGVVTWLMYLALEPYVRRLWPESLVSWTRVLIGRIRDPQVGRDVLFAAAAALSIDAARAWILPWLQGLLGKPVVPAISDIVGQGGPVPDAGTALGEIMIMAESSVYLPMAAVLLLMLIRLGVRRNWLAGVVFVAIVGGIAFASNQTDPVTVLWGILFVATFAVLMLRLGLLAVVAFAFFSSIDAGYLTLDPSRWYSGAAFVQLALFAAMIVWAFTAATGRRPVFAASGVDRTSGS